VGPSAAPFGNEHPYRGAHPGFTRRLATLVNKLWDCEVRFAHPNIWRTKGELLRLAMDTAGFEGWQRSRSCSLDIGRTKGLGRVPETRHCGICGGCLSRRFSLMAADLQDSEPYFWEDLGGPKLNVRAGFPGVATSRLDVETATYAVLDAVALAESRNRDLSLLGRELDDALDMNDEDSADRLARLFTAHHREWQEFLAELPTMSWVRAVAEGGGVCQ
jgi:hypothetical protein